MEVGVPCLVEESVVELQKQCRYGEVNIERHPLEGRGMREVEVSASLALRRGFFVSRSCRGCLACMTGGGRRGRKKRRM